MTWAIRRDPTDGWVGVEEFGKSKLDWFKQFLELPNGIPSHDTFGRVFSRLPGHDTKLHHEDLDSYQAAIEFLALSAGLFEAIPRGYAFLTDQLKRASLSIPLNIAEGYGKRGDKDRSRFYDIARGSAHVPHPFHLRQLRS